MNLLSIRSVCTLASLACLIVAFLIAAYLSAASGDWLALEHVGLKLAGGVAFAFSLYFGSSAAYKRVLWIQLFRNKRLLCVLGSIATLISAYCLILILPSFMHMRVNWWLHLTPLLLSTLVAATCFRAGADWQAFGFFSLVFSFPLGLLSIGPILYAIFPPPPDPVGGNGINMGIQLMLMIPFASVALPTWIASMFFERWRIAWRITMCLFCLPGSVVLACYLTQIVR